jgi:predicted RNA-binding protein with RPS1 domain
MITIEMEPSQLGTALKLISQDKSAVVELNNDHTAGHIHTSQIDADFTYNQHTLTFTNEVKHGMYKIVTDDTIEQHLKSLLATLPPTA